MPEVKDPKHQFRRYVFVVLCVLTIVPITGVWLHRPVVLPGDTPPAISTNEVDDFSSQKIAPENIGDAWHWENFSDTPPLVTAASKDGSDASANEERFSRIDADFIYKALENVKIDSNGDVIVDNDGLQALYNTVGYGNRTLTEAQLVYVQRVILSALPEKSGSQTAQIVADFYRYLEAKTELDSLYENKTDLQSQQAKIADVQILRELYMGDDVAAALFARQKMHEDYMVANMAISLDESLTDEERVQQRTALATRTYNQPPRINNWDTRHAEFVRQKQSILDAPLTDAEKETQISYLFEQHFSSAESQEIQHLNLTDF